MRKSVAAMLVLVFLTASCLVVAKPAFSSAAEAENTWTQKAPMQVARFILGAAVVNDKIYAIGGSAGAGHLDTNEEYDPATDTWTFKAPMPTPNAEFATVVFQNKIYCISKGANEVYNPATDTWQTRTPMPTPREFFTTVVYNDRIYVIGGIVGRDLANELLGTYTGATEVYDPALDKWETKASMLNFRYPEACAVIDGKIYVISGSTTYYESVSFTSVYDEATNTWTSRASMPVVKHGASAVLGDKIYFVGGNNEDSVFVARLQIYDPSTDTWSEGARPPQGGVSQRSAFATTGELSPRRIYVVGPSLCIYNPQKNSWTLGPNRTNDRYFMGVAVLNDRIYAMGGLTEVWPFATISPTITTYAINEQYTPFGYGTIPPVVSVLSPENNKTYTVSNASLTFTVDRPVVWMGYSLDGRENVTITGNTTLSGLPNGFHNITVYARNEFEKTGVSEIISFSVEVPFPVVPVAVASVAIVAVASVSLLVYFKKRNYAKTNKHSEIEQSSAS